MISCLAYTQTDEIKTLEKELKRAKGNAYITKSFALGDLYMREGLFDTAISTYMGAADEADKNKNSATGATVCSTIATKILSSAPKEDKFIRYALMAIDRSIEKDITSMIEIQMDLLERIKRSTKNKKILSNTDKSIKILETRRLKAMPEEAILEEIKSLQDVNKNLSNVNENLEENVEEFRELTQESKKEIQKLSEIQAKAELENRILQQQFDSIEFARKRDTWLQEKDELLEAQEEADQIAEMKLSKQRQSLSYAIAALIGLLSLFLFLGLRSSKKHNHALTAKNKIIDTEKRKFQRICC